jgi:hypothetical protein
VNQVKIPELGQGYICGNTTELRYIGGDLRKSSLFLLTVNFLQGSLFILLLFFSFFFVEERKGRREDSQRNL